MHFVIELAKDSARSPKRAHYKTVYMMLGTKEKDVTRVTLEFLNDIIPVFEKFLLPFQKSSPVTHVVYGSLCDILLKLIRFLKPQATEKKYGAELASIECTNTKLQLADKEMVIGDGTWKTLSAHKHKNKRDQCLE